MRGTATVPPSDAWVLTASGRRFDLLAPDASAVDAKDLAHALSQLCRFGGHTRVPYSVAEHSLFVSRLVPERMALAGLLHDAAEAYVGDCVGPLAHRLPEFRAVEERIQRAIGRRFGVPFDDFRSPELRHADAVALLTERESLLPPSTHPWAEDLRGVSPLATPIYPMGHRHAKDRFLARLHDLSTRTGPS